MSPIEKRRWGGLSNAAMDLIVIAAVFITTIVCSYFFNVFYFIVTFVKRHPNGIVYIDEIFMGFLVLVAGFAVFSWRRWTELNRETAERIRLQEELVKAATTKVEIERIICKQLRAEIDFRKCDEKNVRAKHCA